MLNGMSNTEAAASDKQDSNRLQLNGNHVTCVSFLLVVVVFFPGEGKGKALLNESYFTIIFYKCVRTLYVSHCIIRCYVPSKKKIELMSRNVPLNGVCVLLCECVHVSTLSQC